MTTATTKKFSAALLVSVSLASGVGCATAGSTLDGTHWKLIGWTLSSQTPSDFAIDAKIADGQISGRSAVNSYSGTCKLGPNDAIAIGPLATTRMAGPEPAMRAETGYLTLLAKAKTFKRTNDTLALYDEAGNETLIFQAAGP